MLRTRGERHHAELISTLRRIHAILEQRVSKFYPASTILFFDESSLNLLSVKDPTKSILEIGVAAALEDVYWDEESFEKRGGVYEWTRVPEQAAHQSNPELEW